MNKAFIFIILLLIPLIVNYSTPCHWEPANVPKTNLWTVNDLFTKWKNKQNLKQTLSFWLKIFAFARLLCLSLYCLAHRRNVTFNCRNDFEHIIMVFSTFKIIVLFPTRVIATEGIHVYNVCSVINLAICCWFLNLVWLFIIWKTQSTALFALHTRYYV